MKEQKILDHIHNSIDNMTPNIAEDIFHKAQEEWTITRTDQNYNEQLDYQQITQNTFYSSPTHASTKQNMRTHATIIKSFLTVAACLLLFVGIRTFQSKQIATNIYLDINPSICISLNKNNVVLSVTALNEDGKPIVNTLKDYTGKDVDSFIGETVSVLSDTGYLSTDNPTILISVENADEQKSTVIMDNVSHCMHDNLSKKNLAGSVITQRMSPDDVEAKDLSKDMNISPGKASFINHMVEQNDELEEKDLAKMNIDKLIEKGNKKNIDFNQFSSCSEHISSSPDMESISQGEDSHDISNDKESLNDNSEENNGSKPRPSNKDTKKPKNEHEEDMPTKNEDEDHRDNQKNEHDDRDGKNGGRDRKKDKNNDPDDDNKDDRKNKDNDPDDDNRDDRKDKDDEQEDEDNQENDEDDSEDDGKHKKPGRKPEAPNDDTTNPTVEPTPTPIETPSPSDDHREPHPEKPPGRER